MRIKTYFGVTIPPKYQLDNERALAFAVGKLKSEEKLDYKLSSLNQADYQKIKSFAQSLRNYGLGDCNLDAVMPLVRGNHDLSRKLSLDLAYTCGLGYIPEESINPEKLEKNVRWSRVRESIIVPRSIGRDTCIVISAMHRNPSFIPWDCWEELELECSELME